MTHPTERAALEYLDRGWSVIPILPNDKRPAVPWEIFQTQHATPESVGRWVFDRPDMNLAVVTGSISGVIVVDVDGDAGRDSMLEFDARMPRTLMAKSPHGWHLFFAHDGREQRNRTGLFPGVDIRGDGGYVLVAPSVVDGDTYHWLREAPLAPFPRWLVAEADARRLGRKGITLVPDTASMAMEARREVPAWIRQALTDGALEGQRNDTATRLAGYFVSRGLPVDVVAQVLEPFREACDPPMARAELAGVIASVSRYQTRARTAGVVDPPEFHKTATGERYIWPRAGVSISLDNVTSERGRLMAEVQIDCVLPGLPERLHGPVRLDLLSTEARFGLARFLDKRLPLTWHDLLEVACRLAIEAYREGEPMIMLRDAVRPDEGGFAVDPIALASDPTIWFADGGSGKSLLALTLAVSLDMKLDNYDGTCALLGLQVPARRKVLYLDWEWEAWRHRDRLAELLGEFVADCGVMYRRMTGPLVNQANEVARIVNENGIQFVIIDSVGLACGGEPENAGVATAFANAVRALSVGSLWISHVTKESDGKKAFGCYSADTEYLSRDGWRRHGQWRPGEEVLCFDPETSSMQWQIPTHLHEYDYDGRMLHVKTASMECLVTPNHRMLVKAAWPWSVDGPRTKFKRGRWEFTEAQRLGTSAFKAPVGGLPALMDVEDREEIVLPDGARYPADDFLRLVGWWVAEGSIDKRALSLSQRQGALADEMAACLDRLGVQYSRFDGHWSARYPGREHELPMSYIRTKKSQALADWFSAECGVGCANKRLPDFVFELSVRQRLILLAALVDGDGSVRPSGAFVYCTTSEQLANQVQALVLTCGMPANVRLTRRSEAGRGELDYYSVKVVPHRTEISLRTHRHARWVPYSGKVYCFTVPSGAYVTRRNGRMAIQGNSAYWHNLVRSSWYLENRASPGSPEIRVAFHHRKANSGMLQPSIGYRITFGAGTMEITKTDLGGEPAFRESLTPRSRILAALAEAPKSAGDLAEETTLTVKVVTDTLQRLHGQRRVQAYADGRWALAEAPKLTVGGKPAGRPDGDDQIAW